MIYKSENLSLEDILQKDLSVKIHTKNLQLLMLEVYKSRNKLNPEFMWDLFRVKESHYSLRAGEVLIIRGSGILLWNYGIPYQITLNNQKV